MAKKKVKQETTQRRDFKRHLKIVHSFLNGDFRKLKPEELNDPEVFKELFGSGKFEAYKLRAIYEYQN